MKAHKEAYPMNSAMAVKLDQLSSVRRVYCVFRRREDGSDKAVGL